MDEKSFSYKTLRNSSYLLMGFILPMFFTIFVTRQLAVKLGSAEYGIFLLVGAISAFVGYVDLGLSTAVTKYAAEYHASGNRLGLEGLLNSARLLFLVTGSLGLIIFLILGLWFLPAFHVSAESVPHILVVFGLAGLVFLFNSLGAVYSAILTSLQRFDIITKLSMANLVFTSFATIGLLELHFRLKAVMGLNALAAFLVLAVSHFLARKFMPEVRFRLTFVKSEIIKAYKFGLLTFISSLASTCLVYVDRLIIPIFLGPSQLAFYSVPGNVALKTSGLTNNLTSMFFPMASAFSASGEMDKLKNVYIRSLRNLSVIAAAITVAIILFANKILFFWLGSEYASRGTKVLVISAFTYYIISLYLPLQNILLGLGRLKFLILQSLGMAAINLALLLVLVPRFGIIGAAWAYLVSVLPMIFGFYWVERNIFKITGQIGYYFRLYGKLIITAAITSAVIYFLLLPFTSNVWRLAAIGPFSVLLFLVFYYLFKFADKEDEVLVKAFLKQFIKFRKNR